jgi:hypothetical protein
LVATLHLHSSHGRQKDALRLASYNPLPNSIVRGIEQPGYLGDAIAMARKQSYMSSLGYSAYGSASHGFKRWNTTQALREHATSKRLALDAGVSQT